MTRTMKQAHEWRRFREAELAAQIQINEAILRSLRTELAEVRNLDGRDLVMRYGWDSPRELARIERSKREWAQTIEDLFAEGELARIGA